MSLFRESVWQGQLQDSPQQLFWRPWFLLSLSERCQVTVKVQNTVTFSDKATFWVLVD